MYVLYDISRALCGTENTNPCIRTQLLVSTQTFVFKHVIPVGTHVFVFLRVPQEDSPPP
jgi:hypothetical protein